MEGHLDKDNSMVVRERNPESFAHSTENVKFCTLLNLRAVVVLFVETLRRSHTTVGRAVAEVSERN